MAIVAGDILKKLSIKSGAAGNSAAQPTPAASLGKYISTTQVGVALHDLFDVISGAENAASTVDYRCIFIHNSHGSLVAQSVGIYVSSQVAGGASVEIGVDTTAASAIGAAPAQALEVANETTAPVGVAFSAPTTAGTALAMGNIAAGSCRALWIKRTAANTVAVDADGATLGIVLDTAA